MNETLFSALCFVLFGMALVWLVLVKLLFRRLEQTHPQKYEAMGRPSLFRRNSPSAIFAMLKFLAMREHRALNDSYLAKFSDGMLVFLFLSFVLFFTLLFLVYGP